MSRKKRSRRSFTRSFSDPLTAALMTAAVLWAVFLLGGYVPFGPNTPAVTDAKLQYLDLFAYYRDVLTGQNSAVYTFSNTLGGTAAAIWAYYLASPFNLLVLLFPKEQMNLFLEVLITVKLSAASAAFAWMTGHRFKGRVSREWTLLLSVGYGLMQYTLAQGSNVMWLDGVILLPFIVSGIHGAASSRRFRLAELAVPAGLSVLANWYTGGINYLFSAVWFLYEMIRRDAAKKKKGSLRHGRGEISATAGRYLLGMGTGLLLAAFLFLPNVLALRQGKGGSWNPIGEIFAGGFSPGLRGNPLSVLRSYRIGERSDISRVSFFCGTPAVFGAAAYFFSDRIAKREKAAILIPALTAWMACFWTPLFYIFSLFVRNTSYWYRFGYLGSFVLLYCAAYWAGSLPEKGGFRSLRSWSAIPKAGGLCLLLLLVSQRVWPSGGKGSTRIAVLMLTIMTVLTGLRYAPDSVRELFGESLSPKGSPDESRALPEHSGESRPRQGASGRQAKEMRRRRILALLLVCVGLWEAFLQTRAMLRIYHTDMAREYVSYSKEAQAQIGALKASDEEGFYRISQTATRITNADGLTGAYLDPMAYGYASITGYTSCPENMQLEFLDRLGYRKEYESFNIVNTSFLPADSLLGVRYVLSPYEIPGLEAIGELGSHNGKAVYKNPYALPVAMILGDRGEAAPESAQDDPFAYTNDLFSRIAGQEAALWTPVSAEKTYDRGVTEWKLAIPSGERSKYCLYGNLPWISKVSYDNPQWWDDAQEQGKLTVAEGWSFGYSGWQSPSVFYIPVSGNSETTMITLETDGEPELRDEQFYALDLERFAAVTEQIREKAAAVRDLKVTNGKISCTVDASEGQKLLLSVPASKGWTALRNGREVEIGAFEGALIEIPLVAGENQITMRYKVPGLTAGILLTLAGVAILISDRAMPFSRRREFNLKKHLDERGAVK